MARRGVISYKTNDRVKRGFPDIYFMGGNWIESKLWSGWPRVSNSPLKAFSGNQKSFLDTHTKCGEGCFAAVLWDVTFDQRAFIFMPWYQFRRIIGWDIGAIRQFGLSVSFTGPDFGMERFFSSGKFDPFLWWQQRWQEWPGRHDRKAYRDSWREPTLDDLVRNIDRERENDDQERDCKIGGSTPIDAGNGAGGSGEGPDDAEGD